MLPVSILLVLQLKRMLKSRGEKREIRKGCFMKEQTVARQFTNRALVRLILPLVCEQMLLVTVGMVNTAMVSYCGEAAVSGISLVEQINLLLNQLFAALATGGAVVVSQYLGRQENRNASDAAQQLIWFTGFLTIGLACLIFVFYRQILAGIFGDVEKDVMDAACIYLKISALSYPFLGLYNSGAAIFRSMGNSAHPLLAALVMNAINLGINAHLIFGLGWGVEGAAAGSLISRAVAAALLFVLLRQSGGAITLQGLRRPRFTAPILRGILRIGIPNGLENSIFEVGKLLVAGLIASYGTVALAANAVSNNIANFMNVPGTAMGLAMITIVGQCVGAGDYQQTRSYIKKLLAASYICMFAASAAVFLGISSMLTWYSLSEQTAALTRFVIRYNCLCCVVVWPMSFTMPNALRAAGDAKYTMTVSLASMWLCRVGLSYVLGSWLHLGFFGVWMAMTIDWAVRAVFFGWRYKSGKWEKRRVIE